MDQGTAATDKRHAIVVGFDFSELSVKAVEEALEVAARRPPTTLHVVVVTLPSGAMLLLPGSINPITEEMAREAVRLRITEIVNEYHAKRGPTGIDEVVTYIRGGLSAAHTGHLIAEVAKDVDAEVVVVGSHGRKGLDRVMLGSVAERVVREAPASV